MRNFRSLFLLILFFSLGVKAQEWKSMRVYKKRTGFEVLQDGCWLKKDRKKKTQVWNNANRFNLKDSLGNTKYTSLSQRRDFYKWFDSERQRLGHEVEWVGYAAIISKQFSNLDNGFIRVFIVRNKEVVGFVNEGSKKVFAYAFPALRDVYFNEIPLLGKLAIDWDDSHGRAEQCSIVDPLYIKLSTKALKKINRMAQGKNVFGFGAPKEIRFNGQIGNCELRVQHMEIKIKPYYKKNLKLKK